MLKIIGEFILRHHHHNLLKTEAQTAPSYIFQLIYKINSDYFHTRINGLCNGDGDLHTCYMQYVFLSLLSLFPFLIMYQMYLLSLFS
jgi:hypothetical protein